MTEISTRLAGPLTRLCPLAFVSDFMLSEGLHVLQRDTVRGMKAQAGSCGRDGREGWGNVSSSPPTRPARPAYRCPGSAGLDALQEGPLPRAGPRAPASCGPAHNARLAWACPGRASVAVLLSSGLSLKRRQVRSPGGSLAAKEDARAALSSGLLCVQSSGSRGQEHSRRRGSRPRRRATLTGPETAC